MDIIRDILLRFFVAILCAGGVVGVLVGAGMLLKPERIAFLNRYFSGWFSMDKVEQQLDCPHWTERYLYRHHRFVGGVLLIGAVFVLYTFLFSYNVRRISAAMAPNDWGLWDALVAMLLIGSVVAALVGGIVLVRPSLLREIEKSSNRWVATDGMAKFFNKMLYSPDQYLLRRGKTTGIVIILGSLYVLIVLGPLLWPGGWKF